MRLLLPLEKNCRGTELSAREIEVVPIAEKILLQHQMFKYVRLCIATFV